MSVFDTFGGIGSSGLGTGGPAVSGGPFQSGPFSFGKNSGPSWLLFAVVAVTAGVTYYLSK